MGYAFFICSCDQFLSNLEWLHILIFFSSLFVGVGIGIALLAHPFRGSFARNQQPPSAVIFILFYMSTGKQVSRILISCG